MSLVKLVGTTLTITNLTKNVCVFPTCVRPNGQPCLDTKEFDLLNNMMQAVNEERYDEAGNFSLALCLNSPISKSFFFNLVILVLFIYLNCLYCVWFQWMLQLSGETSLASFKQNAN